MRKIRLYLVVILAFAVQLSFAQEDSYLQELIADGFDIINIENDGVRRYMEDRTYDSPSGMGKYNVSVISKYSSSFPSRPNGKSISWQQYSDPEQIFYNVVTVSERSDFNKDYSKYYYLPGTVSQYTICNMLPNKKYYFKVTEYDELGGEMEMLRGKFYTTGQIRMLRIDGMANIRDFGGWETSFGVRTKYGHLFRGNRPDGITDSGRNDFVDQEQLGADLDLRGKPMATSPFGNNVDYFCTNNARYKGALVGNTKIFVDDFHFIAEEFRKGRSVFLHCNHGANRAGTLSFLLDGMLGLSESDISRDYELSAFAYKGMKRGSNIGEMIAYIRTFGEPGDSLTQCFNKYFEKIGVPEMDIREIRRVMLNFN